MSSFHNEGTSDGDERTDADDQPELTDLEARIRDLEVEVYGYDQKEHTAGRQAVVDVKRTIVFLDNRLEDGSRSGVPLEDIYRVAEVIGLQRPVAEQAYEKLRRHGEVYEVVSEEVRTT